MNESYHLESDTHPPSTVFLFMNNGKSGFENMKKKETSLFSSDTIGDSASDVSTAYAVLEHIINITII
jgi:hypothetical protein